MQRANTLTVQHLSTETAVLIAQRSVQLCADRGFAVSATVVDRSGNVLAAVRANHAGAATLEGSRRKAYTAVNFGMTSGAIEKLVRADPSLRALGDIHDLLPLQGAVLVKVNDQIVGAIGVGGATGEIDEEMAAQSVTDVLQ